MKIGNEYSCGLNSLESPLPPEKAYQKRIIFHLDKYRGRGYIGRMKDCCDTHIHPDHGKEISRVNRIVGQLEGVKKMIEEQRYCPDILTQLRAASSATKSLEAKILESHLGSCVAEAFESGNIDDQQKKVSELITLFKRYD